MQLSLRTIWLLCFSVAVLRGLLSPHKLAGLAPGAGWIALISVAAAHVYLLYLVALLFNIAYIWTQLDSSWTLAAKARSSVFCLVTGAVLFAPIWPVSAEDRGWLFNYNSGGSGGSRFFYAQTIGLNHVHTQPFVTVQTSQFENGICTARNQTSAELRRRTNMIDAEYIESSLEPLKRPTTSGSTFDKLVEFQLRATGPKPPTSEDKLNELYADMMPVTQVWSKFWAQMSSFGQDFVFKHDLTSMWRYMICLPFMYEFLNPVNVLRRRFAQDWRRVCDKIRGLIKDCDQPELAPTAQWSDEMLGYQISAEVIASSISVSAVFYVMLSHFEQFRDRLQNEEGFMRRFIYESVRCGSNTGPASRSIGMVFCIAASEQSFAEPHKFNPDRYTDTAILESTLWGTGSRACPAKQFVLAWGDKTLKHLLQKYTIEVQKPSGDALVDVRAMKRFSLADRPYEFVLHQKPAA